MSTTLPRTLIDAFNEGYARTMHNHYVAVRTQWSTETRSKLMLAVCNHLLKLMRQHSITLAHALQRMAPELRTSQGRMLLHAAAAYIALHEVPAGTVLTELEPLAQG